MSEFGGRQPATGVSPGLAQLDTDLQQLTRAINALIAQTSLGTVIPIANGGTGATTPAGARFNLGIGTAGTKAASDNAQPNLASIIQPVTIGHLAVFADAQGTIEDGGTLPGSFGSAATKAASDVTSPTLSSVIGTIVPGHIASFADANGSVQDGGVLGTMAAQTYATGTWIPILRFGGLTTGIAYTAQLGTFTRLGREITCRLRIVLTSKGTAVGAATIAGLPFTSNADVTNTGSGGLVLNYSGMALVNAAAPILDVGPSSAIASLVGQGLAASAALTDTAFTNAAVLNATFSYFI